VVHGHHVEDFYRRMADKLDAMRQGLSSDNPIDYKFAAFLSTAAREFREDANSLAQRLLNETV
jgi:hypothetical protein